MIKFWNLDLQFYELFYQSLTKKTYCSDNSDIQHLPATVMRHSGSTAWPPSSTKTWVKWPTGIPPDTSLKKRNTHQKRYLSDMSVQHRSCCVTLQNDKRVKTVTNTE